MPTGGPSVGLSLAHFLEDVPAACFVTRGAQHVLVSANAAARRLLAMDDSLSIGRPMGDVLPGTFGDALVALLDQGFWTGLVLRDRDIAAMDGDDARWFCSVWPQATDEAGVVHQMAELRVAPVPEAGFALQRRVTERMLLSALRERDAAELAEAARERAAFLAHAGQRLAGSLDKATTEREVRRAALPHPDAWCIVDLLEEDDTMHRLSIVHPDPIKQALARELAGTWEPMPGEPFGVMAMQRDERPVVVGVQAALLAPTQSLEVRRILVELGLGPLLIVPLRIDGRLAGALTFVSGAPGQEYVAEDIELAEALALRCAMALDSARQHAAAVATSLRAEEASRAKSIFLGSMSHELRTPLNAIGGYVDLIDMGLRGPVTSQQRADLARVRLSLQHLVALITNVLNLVKVDEAATTYHLARVPADGAMVMVVDMLEPLIRQKGVTHEVITGGPSVVAQADPERVTQILVNLVANAIKFTPAGGHLTLGADATTHTVQLHVQDTGIGIAPDDCTLLFEPFVQVHGGRAASEGGTGLGLAISRALARGMGGDLTVHSTLGAGSRFTLSLPRAN